MKIKTFFTINLIAILLITIVGCASSSDSAENDSTVEKAIENGKLALADKDYEKAKSNFELALSENKDNQEAKDWLALTGSLETLSDHLQNKELDKAEEDIESIKSDELYDAIKSQVDDYETELTELQSSKKDIDAQISDLNDKLEEGKYAEVLESGNALKSDENVTATQLAEIDSILESAKEKQEETTAAAQEEQAAQEEETTPAETEDEQSSSSTLNLDEMRQLAKSYVDNWNGYDNVLRDEWDSGDVRVYEFQDGPTEHIIGVTVNYQTGEVTPDQGMFSSGGN